MACDIAAARGISCRDKIGGLKAVFFCKDYSNDILASATVTASSYTIATAGFANWEAYASTLTVYKYDLVTDLSNFTVAIEADKATGSVMWNQTLNLVLQDTAAADLWQLGLISQNRAQIFVQDNNDQVFLMGINDGCYFTGGDSITTGANRSDMYGMNWTFTAKEKRPLYILNKTAGITVAKYPFDGLTDEADMTIVSA